MTEVTRIYDKFEYHLEDVKCEFCSNFISNKRGCKLAKCPFEDIRQDAIKHGRIKRRRGYFKWDG